MAALRAVTVDDEPHLLVLNNADAAHTSLLDIPRLHAMLAGSFLSATIGDAEALLIAFDQSAAYDSPNFLWFKARLDRFVYVDRIVIAARARGRGLGRLLYSALFTCALEAGHSQVVCEVNSEPPNPGSDRFHAALGFVDVGGAALWGGKRVRYLLRLLTQAEGQEGKGVALDPLGP